MCNNCIHKPVCSIYNATGGEIIRCRYRKEELRGRWVNGSCSRCGGAVPTDNRYDYMNDSDSVFCPYCGADMRGEKDA